MFIWFGLKQIYKIFRVGTSTHWNFKQFKLEYRFKVVHLKEPLGYLEFLAIQKNAALVVTNSGGMQEESTYLGIPCLTLRENTKRPITVTEGTNYLIGRDMDQLQSVFNEILAGKAKKGSIPPYWDGNTGKRMAKIIAKSFAVCL